MKTHAGWTYYPLLPGVFVWHSPHGHTWLRDQDGTTDLTPDTAEPPGERRCEDLRPDVIRSGCPGGQNV